MTWKKNIAVRAIAEVALGRQRSPEHAEGPFMVKYLRAANVKDGELDLSDVMTMNFTPSEQRIFRLRPGDVLVTEGSGSLNSVGASAVWQGGSEDIICFQNTLLRMRPRAGITDGRFLGWWARSAFGSGLFASLAGGANIYHLSAERVRAMRVDLPPVEEQRRIADFLDAETSRVDTLVTLRARQRAVVEERWEASIYEQILDVKAESTELRRLGVSVTTGPFGTAFSASEYQDGGIPMINPVHIRGGRIFPDEGHAVSPTTARRLSRHRLMNGDLVVGRKGDIGRAALVGAEQDGWICGSDSIALHIAGHQLRPLFLAHVLRSPYVRSQLLSRSLAATMPSLSEGNLLGLSVPAASLVRQPHLLTVS